MFYNLVSTKNIFFKFASVGVAATLIHAVIYYLLITMGNFDAQIANLVGYIFAFSMSYVGQRKWTFKHIRIEKEHVVKVRFLVSSIFSLLLNVVWVYIVDRLLELSANYSLIGIVLFTPLLTFFILKRWVFKEN
ncbi:MAG: putative flippase GtrA [bacterium]|jgi:putative flippase GtrA